MAKSLDAYNAKRDFSKTPEPLGKPAATPGNAYVIQKHAARRLHYDFRLELDGVLKSWAVPEGPSLIAGKKRLAVATEDHPLDYGGFEGVIPEGQYGSGTVMIWDQGTWTPDFDPAFGYKKGHLKFHLTGRKLKGQWHLVRMKPRLRERGPREKNENWLLFKSDDEAARPADAPDILAEKPHSAATGRSIEAIGREQDRVWASGQGEVTEAEEEAPAQDAPSMPLPSRRQRRRRCRASSSPALPTATETAPSGGGWLHEIKHDGYRLQAHLENGRVKLFSRQGLDWTERFPVVAHALAEVPAKVAIIDGEVVVQTAAGVASFAMLVDALKSGGGDMLFYAFDLLYLDGFDLREAPLGARKAALAELLADAGNAGRIRYSDHIAGDGDAVFRHASRLGLEGIISKQAAAPYRSGRVKTWLKVKSSQSDSFVIAGFVPSTIDPKSVGALVLGEYAGNRLMPVGHCGSGFTAAERARAVAAARSLAHHHAAAEGRDGAAQRRALGRAGAVGRDRVSRPHRRRADTPRGVPRARRRQGRQRPAARSRAHGRRPKPRAMASCQGSCQCGSPIPAACCGPTRASPSRGLPSSTARSPTGSCRTWSAGRSACCAIPKASTKRASSRSTPGRG